MTDSSLMSFGGSSHGDVGDKSLCSSSDSPAVRIIENFAVDLETSQQHALVQEQPQVEITVPDGSAAAARSLDTLAIGGEPSAGLVKSDAINAEPMENSGDPISQFTPVENAADPIEDFSFEAGVNTAGLGSDLTGGLFGAQSMDEASALQAAALQHEFGVTDDGFMSVRSEEVHVRNTILDPESQTEVLAHAATQSALLQSLEPPVPQFMWEQTGFLGTVFGQNNLVDELFPTTSLKRPPCHLIDLTGTVDEEAPIQKALRQGQVRRIFLKVFRQSSISNEETQRANFINGWTSIVLMNVFAFSAFDKCRLECEDDELRATVHLTVAECLARKATSTVGKRLGSLKRFVDFCAQSALSPFPLEDRNMHGYLSQLVQDPHASGSSGKSFLEAVRFSSAMLGLRSDETNSISQRVAGLAETLVKRAPIIDQADPLSVDQVKRLERACCSAEPLPDKIILGGILIMVYGSARASDIAKAVKLLVDIDPRPDTPGLDTEPNGFIELGVLCQKGARSDTHRRMLLPVVAPLFSLSGAKWWESWMESRAAMGLAPSGLLDFPLLCRFDADEKPIAQSMIASEIGEFIRQALNIETLKHNKTRSHSCKATVLSWLSKYGTDLPTRRLVGHHLDPTARSAEIYSRDAMSPAVRAVLGVLQAIKSGRFCPDDTRSGRFRPEPAQEGGEEADAASNGSYEFPFSASEHLGGDSDSTGTDSSSDAETERPEEIDDATTLWELLRPELRPKLVQVRSELEKFVHKISCVVHLRKPNSNKFLCGHMLNHRYERREGGASMECPRCTRCFSSKDAS